MLKNKNFFLLWLAYGISTLGDGATTLTLIILINALTHSPASIALLTIAIALPKMVVGLFAGVYVDRWNRKYTMVGSDGIRALLVLLFIIAALSKTLWLIYLVAFLEAAVGTFFDPARNALVQVVVPEEQFMEANSVTQTIIVIAQFAGATLAGLLVGFSHQYSPAFIVDACTFLASVGLVSFVHSKRAQAQQSEIPQRFFHSLGEGLQTVKRNNVLVAIMVTMSMMMFAISPFQVLLVPFAINLLHVPTSVVGVLQGGDTIGNILAASILLSVAARINPTKLFLISIFALGLIIAAFGFAFNIPSLFIILCFIGFISVTLQSAISTVLQKSVSNEVMGRVSSLLEITPGVLSVISMALVGGLSIVIGVRNTFFLAGGLMVLTGLYTLLAFRRVNQVA